MADPIRNFFSSTLVGTYSDTDTSLTIASGSGAKLPDPSVDGEFNLVIYNESEIGVVTTFDGGSTDTRQDLGGTNPEIVRVTAKSGNVLTVIRGQEGTTASAKEAGNTYRIILSATKKVFDDINDAIENVDLTTLTGVEELKFDSTGDEEFGLPSGTTAQRPTSPSAGYMRWNSTLSRVEVYNGTRWAGLSEIGLQQETMGVATATTTANDATAIEVLPFSVEYLVIAGGGGGGADRGSGGGGGAGGYRSSVSGEQSGGLTSAESTISTFTGIPHTVTVGAGGAGGVNSGEGEKGSNSVFSTITSTGGGGGLMRYPADEGNNGGSGGGGGCGSDGNSNNDGGTGTAGQGFDGGFGFNSTNHRTDSSGGGGGASQAGQDSPQNANGGKGGDGIQSSVTGTAIYRAGGGGGGAAFDSNGVRGLGGLGGGGNGGTATGNGDGSGPGGNATVNTGGGGGGAGTRGTGGGGGNAGSGVVILRYPSEFSISIGAGLTGSESTDGSEKYAVITAGTGNVSWSEA